MLPHWMICVLADLPGAPPRIPPTYMHPRPSASGYPVLVNVPLLKHRSIFPASAPPAMPPANPFASLLGSFVVTLPSLRHPYSEELCTEPTSPPISASSASCPLTTTSTLSFTQLTTFVPESMTPAREPTYRFDSPRFSISTTPERRETSRSTAPSVFANSPENAYDTSS